MEVTYHEHMTIAIRYSVVIWTQPLTETSRVMMLFLIDIFLVVVFVLMVCTEIYQFGTSGTENKVQLYVYFGN